MQVQLNTFPVEILTGHFQISGKLEVRGRPSVFVNDASFDVFLVHDATMTPLTPGTSVGAVKTPLLYIPKSEPHAMLIGNLTAADAQLLANVIKLVAFTDTYVIRAAFHVGPETKAEDVFFYSPGPFFPATDSEIYAMRPLAADLGGEADLLFVHRDHVRTYYPE